MLTIDDAEFIKDMYKRELRNAPCSRKHHLNKPGGLLEHLSNVKNAAITLDPKDFQCIALSDIHDIGKARSYKIVWKGNNYEILDVIPNVDHIIHTVNMIASAGLKLTDEELNALQMHHGGWSGLKGEMSELAIKLHYCDMMAMLKEKTY